MSEITDTATALCQAWILRRADGTTFGFTDHDEALEVDGVLCQASSGLSSVALSQSSGLAVDNSEAIGALTSGVLEEADIAQGRYDGAEIWIWVLDWRAPQEAQLRFRGYLGELTRIDGAFRAEIRGLSDRLNSTVGRVYQTACDAVLGDTRCGVDLSGADYRLETTIQEVLADGEIRLADNVGFPDRWFERGVFQVDGAPLVRVKLDVGETGARRIKLWSADHLRFAPGQSVVLTAGCDKRFSTCRRKFDNVVNFQGFPTIPGDDWMLTYPNSNQVMDGGKL